jgi:hypothetical protein
MANDPHWMEHMGLKKNALHHQLGIAPGKKIPAKTLDKAADSPDPLKAKRAQLAKTFAKERP